jgi:serine protease Do
MRLSFLLPLALVAGVVSTASAQRARAGVLAPAAPSTPRAFSFSTAEEDPYAAIGVTTSTSVSARDTLGVLVISVVPDGPAEQAGIQEGDRIAAVNGVSLRLASADVGAPEMSGVMQRRLTRELRKVKPGDRVDLEVYASGRSRTMTVRTASSDELYRKTERRNDDERASLGFVIATTGSLRDTLGVLVMFINDSGPAAAAGLEEGNRIASINGVDLRVSRVDAGDPAIASIKARRLQRELSQMKPGDLADLRVYRNGEFHTMRLRTVRASDLPRSHSSVFIMGDGASFPPMPPMITVPSPNVRVMPRRYMDIDGAQIGEDVRRVIERALQAAGESMEGMGRALDGVGHGLGRTRIQWDDEDAERARHDRQAPSGNTVRARPTYRSAAAAPVADAGDATYAVWTGPVAASPVVMAASPIAPATPSAVITSDGATMSIAGLELAAVDQDLAEYLGEGSERGLLVTRVPEWAGSLRTGDVILRVDGKPVRQGDESILELRPDARVELLRRGARTTVTLPAPR